MPKTIEVSEDLRGEPISYVSEQLVKSLRVFADLAGEGEGEAVEEQVVKATIGGFDTDLGGEVEEVEEVEVEQ